MAGAVCTNWSRQTSVSQSMKGIVLPSIEATGPQCEPDSRGLEITHEGSVGELHLREYYK